MRPAGQKKAKKLEIMDPPHNDLKILYFTNYILFHSALNAGHIIFSQKVFEKCGIRTGSESWKTDAFNHFTDNISLFATNSIRIIIYENSRL